MQIGVMRSYVQPARFDEGSIALLYILHFFFGAVRRDNDVHSTGGTQRRAFDERSDVYSFSIVMWEMVTSKVLICFLCIVFYVRLCVICGRGQNFYACLKIFL